MSEATSLAGKTLFITGASRGIGLAIALRAARDGANIAIAAKTDRPHPKLPGTIHTAAAEIEQAGGQALPLVVDIRDPSQVADGVEATVQRFGGIDICINNASAIQLTGTLETPMRRFDLMHQVNARGTFCVSQACLTHLLRADNPHLLTISPPLNMNPRWFKDHVAYTMAKYGMSMCVLGMAAEFAEHGVGVNALWPRTAIATAALKMLPGVDPDHCRSPEIMADAAHAVLTRPAASTTGNFFIDDEVLAAAGVTDFERYAEDPTKTPYPDFFLD
ncbi:MAG: NAD(P)-dependent oxidoreductase [Pseudomonadota bacterium]